MRKWRPSGRYFFFKVILDILVILCYHVYIKRKEVNTLREYTKAEVLQLFETWADLAADKKIPDPHRFDTALDTLKELDANKKEKAPANK